VNRFIAALACVSPWTQFPAISNAYTPFSSTTSDRYIPLDNLPSCSSHCVMIAPLSHQSRTVLPTSTHQSSNRVSMTPVTSHTCQLCGAATPTFQTACKRRPAYFVTHALRFLCHFVTWVILVNGTTSLCSFPQQIGSRGLRRVNPAHFLMGYEHDPKGPR
jgi:hypothetical protein